MRKLRLDEIDFRVGTAGKSGNGAYCTLLAYKDARVDMAMLDEEFGQGRWQNEYKRDTKGVLQCGIGVHFVNIGWVWKWSNGIESNTEKQKGEYSDAFKRAGFMWGIGRELYDVPTLFVNLNSDEFSIQDNKVKVNGKFKPNKFKWELTDVHIKATDSTGTQRVYAKFDEVQTAPPKVQTAPVQKQSAPTPKAERIIVTEGSSEYLAIVDWIVNGKVNKKGDLVKGTIELAKANYNISDEVEASLKEKIQALAEIV